ncbi:hypothetical protein OED01_13065 [Microbacterium sp. M28]|uniref:hypothetical protein n=1 Tax=Microbacterium sp. M28 TaxID=2962064 RepID=UPI0021F4D08B|nr:hypothetical protein [Microbacterium sp. M28]UYO96526.1 hypothetical protein OED01_13065 [Microbacterium sp. M28]
MEHQAITTLVLTERQAAPEGARDPHRQRRIDALRERDRVLAARSRADRSRRVRMALARCIRRLAEAIEPRRPDCVAAAPDPC